MRIGVVGAGAIGARFGVMLAEAGCEVSLIARGTHLDAIRTNGLTIRRGDETRTRRLAASDKAVEIGPVEVVFFCVKLWSVEEAGEASPDRRRRTRRPTRSHPTVMTRSHSATASDELIAADCGKVPVHANLLITGQRVSGPSALGHPAA